MWMGCEVAPKVGAIDTALPLVGLVCHHVDGLWGSTQGRRWAWSAIMWMGCEVAPKVGAIDTALPLEDLHCYKTFRRIPPPSPDDAGLILLGRGKRLLYMGREFAPSGTEVFRNHRKFPAIFTMKKGRRLMVGSNSVPQDYYSCPLPLDHGYHVLNVKKYTLINIKYQWESKKSNI